MTRFILILISPPQGFFSNIAVSFAINAQGNGYTLVNIQIQH